MINKNSKYCPITQGVSSETYVNFLKLAYETIRKGVHQAQEDFRLDPEQFLYRNSKATYLNGAVKKFFYRGLVNNSLLSKINHLKSHGVDYYVLDGKAIFCLKKMNNKSKVSNYNTERFNKLMSGDVINYSKEMLDSLSDMGIHKPLPVYFVGYVLDNVCNLVDIRVVFYNDFEVTYEESLFETFENDLFNSDKENEVSNYDIEVKPKDVKRKAN